MHLKPPIPRMNSPDSQIKNSTPTGRTIMCGPSSFQNQKEEFFKC